LAAKRPSGLCSKLIHGLRKHCRGLKDRNRNIISARVEVLYARDFGGGRREKRKRVLAGDDPAERSEDIPPSERPRRGGE